MRFFPGPAPLPWGEEEEEGAEVSSSARAEWASQYSGCRAMAASYSCSACCEGVWGCEGVGV